MTKYIHKNNKFSSLLSMKIMFYIMLLISSIISINSSSWFNAWMGMEMNLMMFIPLMMTNFKKMKISNSMMIYFIIQASASSMMLIMIILMKMQINLNKMNLLMNMIQLSLLMKLGASPFHWWSPKVFINLNWMNSFMFLTWQKIAPMFLILTTNNNFLIYLSALFSTFIGAILGMNQTSLKLIMIYSSINHLGWMLMLMIINKNMLMVYFLIYSLINVMICFLLNNININNMNQLFKNNNQNMNYKLISISLFLSLSGLPPFLGALPKMLTLMLMIKMNLLMESFLFVILSIISLSFYMNPLMSMFILTKFNSSWNKKTEQNNKIMLSILMINLILLMTILTPLMNFIM